MSLLSFGAKKDVLGIDIGASTVKILELNVSSGKINVLNFAHEDVGVLGIEDKSPEERKQIYINTVKKLVDSHKFTTKNAAVSISGSSVIVRFVKFPKMSEADFKKTLLFEAEPHIPFDIQDVDIDAQIIGDVEEEDQIKMETVLVASKKETIRDRIDIIEKAGLKPAIIDVDTFALGNAYELIYKDAANKVVMLLNVGASTTNISIMEKGISKVVRDLYVAGKNFTRAIQNEMQITREKAESLKIKYGLSALSGKPVDDMAGQIHGILNPIIRELNSEVQRSIDYFTGQQVSGSEANIEKIILSGGSAKMIGLAEAVSAELRIPVEIFSPLENANVSSVKGASNMDFSSPALAVVTGLAARRIGDHK